MLESDRLVSLCLLEAFSIFFLHFHRGVVAMTFELPHPFLGVIRSFFRHTEIFILQRNSFVCGRAATGCSIISCLAFGNRSHQFVVFESFRWYKHFPWWHHNS